MENQTQTPSKDTTTQNTFRKQIGKTTYEVTVHFSQTSKETINDKIQRLIMSECETLAEKSLND